MLYKHIRREKEMDEQQERDYYEQQKNIPIATPNLFRTYNPIWTSTLTNSRNKFFGERLLMHREMIYKLPPPSCNFPSGHSQPSILLAPNQIRSCKSRASASNHQLLDFDTDV